MLTDIGGTNGEGTPAPLYSPSMIFRVNKNIKGEKEDVAKH